ncbi:Na+/H+ antiporter subunit E [Methylocystis sp. JAN1]|uniref:Na+/H+ antiporter subunit E n=1 Tax=Methylocystis sp. JAN1 TaxID=3397211 RepID=UPI003FA25D1E
MFTDRFPFLICASLRQIAFLCIWIIVSGFSLPNLLIGLLAATAAAWASVALLPCAGRPPGFYASIRLAARIPAQAIAAGVDVARRALDPALPLRPGFVAYSTSLPEGTAQQAFAALAALQPGSVPVRSEAGGIFDIHCLDVRLPIKASLEREEADLRAALGFGADS